MRLVLTAAVLILLGVGLAGTVISDEPTKKAAPKASADDDAKAVQRARKTVRMLDEIYKNAIVLITDKYVNDEDDFPAGSAAVQLFSVITKNGSHAVRLIDVTGEPYKETNVARDAFEKEAAKEIKAGKPYYDRVVEKDGHEYLRAMTAVPVVMKKCVMCHPHYADVKKGEAIGAISYTLKVE